MQNSIDVNKTIELTPDEARQGCTKKITVGNNLCTINIPAGTKNGDKIETDLGNKGKCIVEISVGQTQEGNSPVVKKPVIIAACLAAAFLLVVCLVHFSKGPDVAEEQPSSDYYEETDEEDDENETVGYGKQYGDKDWIFSATYDLKPDVDSYQIGDIIVYASEITVPYFNMTSSDAQETNEYLYSRYYERDVERFNENASNGEEYMLTRYTSYLYNDIVSAAINTETYSNIGSDAPYTLFREGITFDTKTGSRLSIYETASELGYSQDETNQMLQDAVKAKAKEKYLSDDLAEDAANTFFEYFKGYSEYYVDSDGGIFVDTGWIGVKPFRIN